MANSNNIDGVINTTNTQIIGNGYTLPNDFNNSRQPGELANLFNANSNVIYNKFSPKTTYTNGLLNFGPQQPFITRDPNHPPTLINTRSIPLQSAIDDVQRISKWQITGDGIIFIAKQLLLQGQNSFNETKIYNPLMPIQSVTSTLSFGVLPTPTRFIDIGSVGGFLSSVGFGSSDFPPATTVGIVSDQAKKSGNAYKGLLRGATASDANQILNQKWAPQSQGIGNLLSNYFKSGFNKAFGGLIPQSQPDNTQYRGDEGAYGLMLGAKGQFKSSLSTGNGDELQWGDKLYQRWEAGDGSSQGIKKSQQTSIIDSKKLLYVFNGTVPQTAQYFGHSVGYSPKNNNYNYRTYGDNVGIIPIKLNKAGTTSYEYSDILSIYQVYTSKDGTGEQNKKILSPSKFNDKTDDVVKDIIDNLNRAIKNITVSGYTYAPADNADLNMQQFSDSNDIGMDNITYKTKDPFSTSSPNNYNGGYMTQFRFTKRKQLLDDPDGKGFATTNQADKINLLDISSLSSSALNQENPIYDRYRDDQIAFFFYDIVNDKYIPFRATVKGISETNTAEWPDVTYIGRADKLYTYKGFTRTLQFNFTIYINSIKELLPTWKRINYFCGLVKPANYTANTDTNNIFSKFIIPPMVQLTIGDMYKNQPCVITSIGLSIPEDAIWETLCEDGGNNYTNYDKDWNYLNGKFIWKDSKGKYAQFPRVVDLSVSLNILEKEKPIVGGSQYGDAFRDVNFQNLQGSDFSKQLIVSNNK
jgi:hypothetical protein